MTKKITAKLMREALRELAIAGGKARARRYSKKQLSEWAKTGGRPRKDAKKRTSSRGKGRRK
jgi:hypothetical protein